jgi:paraquat-inducible protein B
MSQLKATVVGSFVLGALALGVGATLVFSELHLFKKSLAAVVVFKDSVAGLAVGSPVTFRGVKVGQVTQMKVHFDLRDHTPVIPVVLALEPGKVVWTNAATRGETWDLQDAVRAGLRAQLTQQSLVTGLMSVDIDLHPLAARVPARWLEGVPEIPSIPSDAQLLRDELLGLDLPDIAAKTRLALASLQHTLDAVSAGIGPVSAGLQSTLKRYDGLAAAAQGQIVVDGREFDVLMKSAGLTLTQATTLLTSLNDLAGPDSATRADLDASIRDLAASAGSLREFTHDLQRAPAQTLLRRPAR